nr:unnamed protein product [Callosobruchus chinensis]
MIYRFVVENLMRATFRIFCNLEWKQGTKFYKNIYLPVLEKQNILPIVHKTL